MAISQWTKGVAIYAQEIIEKVRNNYSYDEIATVLASPDSYHKFQRMCLNGASNWKEYSEGGCSFIYGEDIANRLVPQSQIRHLKAGGISVPSKCESWIDVQSRALKQAFDVAYLSVRGNIQHTVDFDKSIKGCLNAAKEYFN